MSWRYHGRYSPDPYASRGRGVCDRCQFVWLLQELQYQYEFRGDALTNTRFRVCPPCMDKPYQGNRPVKLPADPVPLIDPRVEPLLAEENAGQGPFNPSPFTPSGYVTEDGSSSYVTENSTSIYVPD